MCANRLLHGRIGCKPNHQPKNYPYFQNNMTACYTAGRSKFPSLFNVNFCSRFRHSESGAPTARQLLDPMLDIFAENIFGKTFLDFVCRGRG
jgi:hypothetical protein